MNGFIGLFIARYQKGLLLPWLFLFFWSDVECKKGFITTLVPIA
ncbi:hypothetical protein SynBIOSE41_03008 [Synechococcus sp. BIOS-E4-1]|nr:hypothetical protein SynBIOSE41_03008 [Synechococcus sp. BIOS-E4-1]